MNKGEVNTSPLVKEIFPPMGESYPRYDRYQEKENENIGEFHTDFAVSARTVFD